MEASAHPFYHHDDFRGKELFLDTKGTCFLCLTEVSKHRFRGEGVHSGISKVNLRNICRFLKIDSFSTLLKSLQERVQKEDEKKKCEFSVLLCTVCSSLTTNLSELISQMEVIKMLIKHELEVFQQILMDSEAGQVQSALWTKLLKKMASSCENHVETSRLVDALRKEAKAKCSAKVDNIIRTSFPQVRLDRLETSIQKVGRRFSMEVDEAGPSSGTNIFNSPAPILSKRKRIPNPRYSSQQWLQEKECMIVIDEDNERPSTSRETQSVTVTIPNLSIPITKKINQPCNINTASWNATEESLSSIFSEHSKRVDYEGDIAAEHYKCLVCEDSVVFNRKIPFQKHLVNVHPEKVFAHKRLLNETEEAFRARCREILKTEAMNAKSKSTSVGHPAILCSVCNIKCCNGHIYRYHFVMEHYNLLEEKLGQLPEDEGQEDSVGTRVEEMQKLQPVIQIKPVQNDIKNKKTRTNLAQISKPRLRFAKTSLDQADGWICSDADGGCGLRFSTVSRLKKHKLESCAKTMNSSDKIKSPLIGRKPDTTNRTPTINESLEIADGRSNNGANTDENNFRQMRRQPRVSIKPIHKSSTPTISITSRNSSPAALKLLVADFYSEKCKFIKQGTRSLRECPFCEKVFPVGSNIKVHLVSMHTEQFFGSAKFPQISKKAFEEACRHVLRSETKIQTTRLNGSTSDATSGTRLVFCSFCKETFSSGQHLKYHKVIEHYSVLEKKIVDHQRQITLEEATLKRNRVGAKRDDSTELRETVPASEQSEPPNKRPKRHSTMPAIHKANSTTNLSTVEMEVEEGTSSSHHSFASICATHSKKLRNGNQYKCLLCHKNLHEMNIRKHLVNVHPEKFFASSVKFSELPEAEFRDICRRFLKSEIITSTEHQDSKIGGGGALCQYCKHNYAMAYELKYHLVSNHYPELERKFAIFQNEEGNLPSSRSEILSTSSTQQVIRKIEKKRKRPSTRYEADDDGFGPTVDSNSTANLSAVGVEPEVPSKLSFSSICANHIKKLENGNGYKCLLCKKEVHEINRRKHLVNIHPEKFFASVKRAAVSEAAFQSNCKQFLNSEINKSKPAAEQQDSVFECQYCANTYVSSYELRYHLVLNHYQELEKNFVLFQKEGMNSLNRRSNKVSSISSGQKVVPKMERKQRPSTGSSEADGGRGEAVNPNSTNPAAVAVAAEVEVSWKQSFHSICTNHIEKLENGNGYKCLLCEKDVHDANRRKHIVNLHPEKFFDSVKIQAVSETTFEIYCKRFLNSFANKAKAAEEQSRKFECQYCKYSYTLSYELKYHLVLNHYPELKTKFVAFQNEQRKLSSGAPEIMKRKKKLVRSKCSEDDGGCGRTFGSIYTLKRHKMGYCNGKIWGRKTKSAGPNMMVMASNGNESLEAFPTSSHQQVEESDWDVELSSSMEANDSYERDSLSESIEHERHERPFRAVKREGSVARKNNFMVMDEDSMDFEPPIAIPIPIEL